MQKSVIDVPKGIRFFRQLEEEIEFCLEDYPYILDKKIPGCGFTSWALTNSQNIILASPRKMLMTNKEKQINGEGEERQELVFLVSSGQDNSEMDKDLNKFSKASTTQSNDIVDWADLKHKMSQYILKCQFEQRPIKIIVTYDSYRKVREILEGMKLFDTFHTVVDEFQSIFTDSRFKPTTEMEFLENLKTVQKVCYVSATPMMEVYLEQIDYFRNLPYLELDWQKLEPSRVRKPKLNVRSLKSVNTVVKPIIESYKMGKFEHRLVFDKKTQQMKDVESREAVFYVNSVSNIIGIISTCKLMPNEVCILCSNTPNNQKRISKKLDKKKLGIEYLIEEVPRKNQPRKMFTFCTRTVYLGADFYSDNARSFIISDANIDTLAVDITLDLPQIMGRQRLKENPWRREAFIFVKPLMRYKATNIEEFRAWIDKKVKDTNNLLWTYQKTIEEGNIEARDTLVNRLSTLVNDHNYRDDYIAVNQHAGSKPIPVFNSLVLIAEQRAFDIQQLDYVDRFAIMDCILDQFDIEQEQSFEVQMFIDEFERINDFNKKLKFICTTDKKFSNPEWEYIFAEIPNNFRNLFLGLGAERCKALGYSYTKALAEYEVKFFDTGLLRNELSINFPVGLRITSGDAKDKLRDIYRKLGYKKTPKATDLEKYFELKETRVKDQMSGKFTRGYEILKIK